MGLERRPSSRGARWWMGAIVALHFALLLASLRDYLPDNDLGYHVSLARQYGERGTYFWDQLNWAPAGRPNLQGPLLHFSIGVLGRLLGGAGDDYVLAFNLMAVLQWAAAVWTAVFFARRFGGDRAALIAAAAFTGSVWSAAPFFAGVPSGWIFVLTPWAIHFFFQERYLIAALFTSAVVNVHLGGAPVAPFGILLAAVLTRRWKGLLITGGITALLSSVYVIHFLRHLDYYTGRRGHVAGDFNTLAYALAIPGILWLARKPRENLFLLIWPLAALAWAFQDGLRFLLQSAIAASVIGGLFAAALLERIPRPAARTACLAALSLLATVYPLSIPSLALEAGWAFGHGFPRELDWSEARTLAGVVRRDGLQSRIVHSYYDSLSAAMSVYLPMRQEFGHWGEVRPRVNPARDISALEKLYVLPLPPDDEALRGLEERGWLRIHGGSARTSIVTLARSPGWDEVREEALAVVVSECDWLADHAVNNRFPPPGDWLYPERIAQFRRLTTAQRNRAGRIAAAMLPLAAALESLDPDQARGTRGAVRGWGSVANFIGDETAMNYLSDQRFELFRRNLREFSRTLRELQQKGAPLTGAGPVQDKLFRDFFG